MAQAKLLALYNKDSDCVRVSLWADGVLEHGVLELLHGSVKIHSVKINPKTQNIDGTWSIMFNKPTRNLDLNVRAVLVIAGMPYITTADVTIDDNAGELAEVQNEIIDIPVMRTEPLVEITKENAHTDANKVDRKKDHSVDGRPSESVVDLVKDPLLALIAFGEKYPMKKGEGLLQYSGGGNRIYWDDKGALQVQNINTMPFGFAYSEQAANNLLDNVWLSLSANAPTDWFIEVDGSIRVESNLINEIHPTLKQWNVQIAKVINKWDGAVKFTSRPKPISGLVNFSVLANIRNELADLKVVFTWLNGNIIISEDVVAFDAKRFENRWGMLAHTASAVSGATHVSVVIVATPTMGQTPLVKLIMPNIVVADQPTSLIVGNSNRAQDNWRLPTEKNINPEGSAIEIAAILGGDSAGTIFDCRDAFGIGTAALWTGSNISFVVNAGSGDEVIDVPWTVINNVTWKFTWRKNYRAISVNNTMLVENTDSIEMPTSVGTSLLIAQNLNCQLISLKIERSTVQ